jgi:hypothetical protein
MAQYNWWNGTQPTTSAAAKLATSTSIRTLQSLKPAILARPFEWGFSGDGSSAATPGQVEFLETGTVFPTSLTAYQSGDIVGYDSDGLAAGDPASAGYVAAYSTSTSGFNSGSSSEGSVTTTRLLAGPQLIAPTNQFLEQFPLGYRPIMQVNKCERIRATFGTSINVYTYALIEF